MSMPVAVALGTTVQRLFWKLFDRHALRTLRTFRVGPGLQSEVSMDIVSNLPDFHQQGMKHAGQITLE